MLEMIRQYMRALHDQAVIGNVASSPMAMVQSDQSSFHRHETVAQ